MKHLHRILLVLLFALCCSQAIWASVQSAGGKMVVNVETLNMRISPSAESPIETKLHKGDVVEVISGVQKRWVQVQIDGYEYMGYVKYNYLSPCQAKDNSSQSSNESTWSDAIKDQIYLDFLTHSSKLPIYRSSGDDYFRIVFAKYI